MLLLGALGEMGGRSTKREVLEYIDQQHYFHMEAGDRLPFPTALQADPRWQLLVEDVFPACLCGGCLVESKDGLWELTDDGAELYRASLALFRNGTFDVRRCFLWSAEFKGCVVPGYEWQPQDRARPVTLYHDIQWHLAGLGLPRGSTWRKRRLQTAAAAPDLSFSE